MSTLYRLGEEEVVLVTGAPDVLFRLCQYQQKRQRIAAAGSPRTGKAKLKSTPGKGYGWWPQHGSRLPQDETELTHQDLQQGVILLRVAGMMDPPRPEAITAIADCLQAGSREDDHRRPPANGDEHRQDAGDWQCGKCHLPDASWR